MFLRGAEGGPRRGLQLGDIAVLSGLWGLLISRFSILGYAVNLVTLPIFNPNRLLGRLNTRMLSVMLGAMPLGALLEGAWGRSSG